MVTATTTSIISEDRTRGADILKKAKDEFPTPESTVVKKRRLSSVSSDSEVVEKSFKKQQKKSLNLSAPLLERSRSQSALVITHFDDPYDLNKEHPYPELRPYEVLIKNKVVGLNHVDWKAKKFKFAIYSFPWVNGRESSGVVVSHGTKVDDTKLPVNQRVFIVSTSYRDIRTSTFQEYTAIDSRLVWKLPGSFSFENGATIGVGLVTSGMAFHSWGYASSNDRIEKNSKTMLIWGGSSVVALYAMQFAKYFGFKVVSIASEKNAEYIKSFGCDLVVDRHLGFEKIEEIIHSEVKHIDYALDCVSRETSELSLKLIQKVNGEDDDSKSYFIPLVAKPKAEIPKNVQMEEVFIKKFHEDIKLGEEFVNFSTSLFENGNLKPVRHRTFHGGLKGIVDGLLQLEEKGASAEKYVASF
ncbi:Putative quinone oxidoreductase [Komagataella phaffii CBS 7435]|uniref:Enoyl reductase (ER) domain-containing protein n=2 Tax=Komagataella phaffii TaxID=460519 RepID=C4QYG3_KOMPG|nr:uncharacterized protein PAS_chr1-4_0436 [Komagataella phaffii GS115]AOA61655.1 GQ67_01722T0 [Komagataella phaffii]CAH2447109.1 Putative quinone oxidoreductase [Komagataella phaffii CBS 7435]AOA65801.1 GQ68_01737T0 [Komagataella phaffii GS115]CAY68286.1 Putative protein of unknown function [Komagataella phaffii GS115]CCA37355.1 Putative quinone oxidoreductase [Komagataella phaffii CBS 7435]